MSAKNDRIKKEFLIFNGVTETGKHYNGEDILYWLFTSIISGEEMDPPTFGEYTSIEEIIYACTYHADILWIPSIDGIKKINYSIDEIIEFYGGLSDEDENERRRTVMKKFNPENPVLNKEKSRTRKPKKDIK